MWTSPSFAGSDERLGDPTAVDIHAVSEAFWNMSLRSGCFVDGALVW